MTKITYIPVCDPNGFYEKTKQNQLSDIASFQVTNEIKVVKAGMRFGVTKDVFDNLSSGGISVAVSLDGELSKTAHNWYKADPFTEHPSTHIVFAGQVHPHFDKMKALACKYAAKVNNMNMLSWDMLADKDLVSQ